MAYGYTTCIFLIIITTLGYFTTRLFQRALHGFLVSTKIFSIVHSCFWIRFDFSRWTLSPPALLDIHRQFFARILNILLFDSRSFELPIFLTFDTLASEIITKTISITRGFYEDLLSCSFLFFGPISIFHHRSYYNTNHYLHALLFAIKLFWAANF